MEERDYTLFENYISQSLSESEHKAFEKRLKEDAVFLESFELYKETSVFLKHKFSNTSNRAAFKSNLKEARNRQISNDKTVTKKVKLLHPWKLAVAASILLVVGFFYSQWFTTPVYNDYANYPSISLTVRGETNQIAAQAENAFNTQNYPKAIPLFKSLLTNDPENIEVQLFLAVSFVEENAFSKADNIYDSLITTPSAFQNQALYYAALSKLKQKNYDATKSLLQRISKDAEEYALAQKILRKL